MRNRCRDQSLTRISWSAAVMYVGGRRCAAGRGGGKARGRVVDLSASQPSRETDAYRLIAWNVGAASPAGFAPNFRIPFPSKTRSNTAAEGCVSVFGRFDWTGLVSAEAQTLVDLMISIVYFVISTYEGDLSYPCISRLAIKHSFGR